MARLGLITKCCFTNLTVAVLIQITNYVSSRVNLKLTKNCFPLIIQMHKKVKYYFQYSELTLLLGTLTLFLLPQLCSVLQTFALKHNLWHLYKLYWKIATKNGKFRNYSCWRLQTKRICSKQRNKADCPDRACCMLSDAVIIKIYK